MILILLITFTMGFWWGGRVGYQKGQEYGLRTAVFLWKAKMLKAKICPLCGRTHEQDLEALVTKDNDHNPK